MPARADAQQATAALLTIDAGSTVWAIPSGAVANIEPYTEADAETIADVRALLGAGPVDPSQVPRVLTVRVSGQALRLLTRGALRLRTIAVADLVPLPPVLVRETSLVTHVALIDGKPALVVISPDRLLLALHGTDGRSSTTLAHRPEALPC